MNIHHGRGLLPLNDFSRSHSSPWLISGNEPGVVPSSGTNWADWTARKREKLWTLSAA
jgi:hypothetical protein